MGRPVCGWELLLDGTAAVWPAAQAPEPLTLLELVAAVAEFAASDAEVVAVVEHLLASGRVRLMSRSQKPDLIAN